MYRRIECIVNFEWKGVTEWLKGGMMVSCNIPIDKQLEVYNVFYDGMPGPKGDGLGKNMRFYLTEKGWKRFGRPAVKLLRKYGAEFRVLTVKECSVDIQYKDIWQVAVRPRKPKTKRPNYDKYRNYER